MVHHPATSDYAPIPRGYLQNGHPKKRSRAVTVASCIILLRVFGSQRFRQVLRYLSKRVEENKHFKTLLQSSLFCSYMSHGRDVSQFVKNVVQKAVHMMRLEFMSRRIYEGVISSNSNDLSELKRHHVEINRVLSYWFGQYTPDKSQKYLWMIASSSEDHRRKVDADISNKFGQLLLELSQGMMHVWCSDDHGTFGWQGKVAAIIVLDQMSRHIHRHYESTGTLNKVIPCQKTLDEYAFKIAETVQNEHHNDCATGLIPIPMLIFALMPLRHASTLQSVGYVQEKVKEISSFHSSDIENMIRRFRQATNRRMTLLQDQARREGRLTQYDPNGTNRNKIGQDSQSMFDFSDENILEFHPFETDMSAAKNHPVVKTMINFLAEQGVISARKEKGSYSGKDIPLIVSLSGGVDSMVIANVLAYLRDHCGFGLHIVAVHVDYGNRPESSAEVRGSDCM